MSVTFRKSLQAMLVVLPLAFVGGQMPAMAASAASTTAHTADAPPAAPVAPAAPAAQGAPTAQAAPAAPAAQAAPAAPAAQAAPAAPAAQAPAAQSAPAVDPQAQVVQSGSPDHPELGISALDLKEDIAETCAGAPILPFKIGSATTLKDLLVKLHLMDTLTQVCSIETTLGASIEKLTGPGGVVDLDLLLK